MIKNWKRALAAGVILLVGIAAALFLTEENNVTTKTVFAMDTYMELTAYGRNAEEAIAAAEEEIHRLDQLLSTGNTDSEVAIWNRDKTGVLTEDTEYLIERSIQLWEETAGAFDITIYPVMRAWGFVNKAYRVPTEEELRTLLLYVDSSLITIQEEKNLTIPQQVEIDFGGIAKGYASMRVAQIMKEYGIRSAKLNLGGNVQTVGMKPDGSKWRIAIKSPKASLPYLGIVSIGEAAVITSGGYERYFEENGQIYHHIIDPATGKPAKSGLASVTIVCEDGTLADGLSTSLYVMGKEESIAYWRAHSEEFDVILYDENGNLYVTEGLQDAFTSKLPYEIIKRN